LPGENGNGFRGFVLVFRLFVLEWQGKKLVCFAKEQTWCMAIPPETIRGLWLALQAGRTVGC